MDNLKSPKFVLQRSAAYLRYRKGKILVHYGWKWNLAQQLEIRWWQRYLNGKPKQDYLTWKRGYWEGVLQKVALVTGTEPTGKILDAGCGPAGIFMNMQNGATDAVDPLLTEYQSRLQHFSPDDYPNVNFHTLPLEQFVQPDTYNWIFCMNAINHVADIKQCIANLELSLKSEGYLILTVDSHKYNALKALFRTIPGDALHPHQFNLGDYLRLTVKYDLIHLGTVLIRSGNIFNHHLLVFKKW